MNIMMLLALYIWLAVAFTFTSAQTSQFRSVCYYTNWPQYRPGRGMYFPEHVDPSLCTHLVYAFAKPVGLSLAPIENNDDDTPKAQGMYKRIMKLKQRNRSLKVLLAVGGYNLGSGPFIPLVKTEASMSTFASNVVTFLRKRNFDGLEMAWQYPATRGSTPGDKSGFQSLMQTIRQVFEREARQTGKPRLLLTVAVPAGKSTIDNGYMIPELSRVVDFMSIMTYDYHGSWDTFVGFNSPLYAFTGETGYARQLNVNWTANYYVSLGAPKEKLNIAIATYGRSFTLRDNKQHSVLSPATGEGNGGPFTREPGILAYYEICDLLKSGAQSVYVQSQENSYVVKDNQWVGYDDKQSVLKKACYARRNGFGGVAYWSLDFDDFTADSCSEGAYPLIKSANSVRIGSVDSVCKDENVETPTATTVEPPPRITSITDSPGNTGDFRFVCYYTNWAQHRQLPARFVAENIDPSVCTHIIYAFAKPQGLDLVPFEGNDDDKNGTEGMYTRVLRLKAKKPSLKILLATGGYNMGSEPFIPLVKTEYSRTTFSNNVVKFLRKRNFDGFDMDWEYPAARGSEPADKQRFQLLMEKLREVFESEAVQTGRPRLLLTVATAAGKWTLDNGYIVSSLAKVVDFINVMTYDYHGSWERFVGIHSPLYAYSDELGFARQLNTNWTMNYYVSLGAPKKKLNIGIATYGRSFTLSDPNRHTVLSPASGPGRPGSYTGESGIFAYYEVCQLIGLKATVYQVPSQGNPYLVQGNLWVGYDDVASVKKKACYAKKNDFGGIFYWSLDFDDFLGTFCHQGKHPLLKSAMVVLSEDACVSSKVMEFSTSDGTRGIEEANLGYICLYLLIGLVYRM